MKIHYLLHKLANTVTLKVNRFLWQSNLHLWILDTGHTPVLSVSPQHHWDVLFSFRAKPPCQTTAKKLFCSPHVTKQSEEVHAYLDPRPTVVFPNIDHRCFILQETETGTWMELRMNTWVQEDMHKHYITFSRLTVSTGTCHLADALIQSDLQ